jgi:hypothetical protein
MDNSVSYIKLGLALVLLGLAFGIGLGVGFGVYEDGFKGYVADGIAANPEVHDANSQSKIWRYGQRAHFHSNGISAFSFGLLWLVVLSSMSGRAKKITSFLIGLGSLYPLAWFSMYLLAPSIGRSAAHSHPITVSFTYIGVGGLLLGFVFLVGNLYFGLLGNDPSPKENE